MKSEGESRKKLILMLKILLGVLIAVIVKSYIDRAPAATTPATVAVAPKPVVPPKVLTTAEKNQLAANAKKAAAENEKTQEVERVAYAKVMEETILRGGHSVDVVAYGPKHQNLKLKWALVSKAMAFNFFDETPGLWDQMKSEGFKKFTITDGYDESWSWAL